MATVTDYDALVREATTQPAAVPEFPEPQSPSDTVFQLAAGYLQEDGEWVREFEVRELTGRDEEIMARISDPGRLFVSIIDRGVVRVGSTPASKDVLNDLVGGDWDTVLVAIRIVTFGPEMSVRRKCSCGQEYMAVIDLREDVKIRAANQADLQFSVGNRHHYEASLYSGATQRKILEQLTEATVPELNTMVLFDSITSIDGRPPLGLDDIRDMPMTDREIVLNEINKRRVGPDLGGVTTTCPSCGKEQPTPLSAAAMFRR